MLWDATDRRYEDDKGRPVPASKVRKHINDYIKSEQGSVKRESDRLFADEITVAEFFSFMRQKITTWHTVAGVISYGGEAEMNGERWSRINQKILSEIQFLNDFEAQAEQSFAAVDEIADKVAMAPMPDMTLAQKI